MAILLAQLTLVVLCMTGLCVLLLNLPAPRTPLGIGIALLVVVQVAALRHIREAEQVYVYPPTPHRPFDGAAEVVALLVVPTLTTVLLTVLIMYLLEARRAVIARLEHARAARHGGRAVPRA